MPSDRNGPSHSWWWVPPILNGAVQAVIKIAWEAAKEWWHNNSGPA